MKSTLWACQRPRAVGGGRYVAEQTTYHSGGQGHHSGGQMRRQCALFYLSIGCGWVQYALAGDVPEGLEINIHVRQDHVPLEETVPGTPGLASRLLYQKPRRSSHSLKTGTLGERELQARGGIAFGAGLVIRTRSRGGRCPRIDGNRGSR